jgi:ribosomal protein S18 acetylase RimI-like enzyme
MALVLPAYTPEQISQVRTLFLEYASSLSFDLCFQNFASEVDHLPGDYASPDGRLFLAFEGGQPAGCIALRKLNARSCEMKRLFVRPAFRGTGIGRMLSVHLIGEARVIGYHSMLLDTINTMTEAIALYRSLGFTEIEPYTHNPIPGVVYFEFLL